MSSPHSHVYAWLHICVCLENLQFQCQATYMAVIPPCTHTNTHKQTKTSAYNVFPALPCICLTSYMCLFRNLQFQCQATYIVVIPPCTHTNAHKQTKTSAFNVFPALPCICLTSYMCLFGKPAIPMSSDLYGCHSSLHTHKCTQTNKGQCLQCLPRTPMYMPDFIYVSVWKTCNSNVKRLK